MKKYPFYKEYINQRKEKMKAIKEEKRKIKMQRKSKQKEI
jgi:hypothetical protein